MPNLMYLPFSHVLAEMILPFSSCTKCTMCSDCSSLTGLLSCSPDLVSIVSSSIVFGFSEIACGSSGSSGRVEVSRGTLVSSVVTSFSVAWSAGFGEVTVL